MNPKTQKRLEALLATFDEGAIQPEELMKAIDAVMSVIKQSQDAIFSKIDTTDQSVKSVLVGLKNELKGATDRLTEQTKVLSQVSASKDSVNTLGTKLKSEIERVISLIPVLPNEFDASDIYSEIQSHKKILDNLSLLILGENIRNALESLKDEDRLDVSAVKGLEQFVTSQKTINDGGLRKTNGWNNGSDTLFNRLTVSATEPINPQENDLWCDIS